MQFFQKGGWLCLHDGQPGIHDISVFPCTWPVVLPAVHVHQSALRVVPYTIEDVRFQAVCELDFRQMNL